MLLLLRRSAIIDTATYSPTGLGIEIGSAQGLAGAEMTISRIWTPSGGIEVGGQPAAGAIVSLSVSSFGGIEVGGQASIQYSQPASGGIEVGGQSVVSVQLVAGALNDGLEVGGSADVALGMVTEPSGGLEVGGLVSTESIRAWFWIPGVGGIEVGGSATGAGYGLVAGEGGLEISGQAVLSVNLVAGALNDGLEVGGSADVARGMAYDPVGGIEVGGVGASDSSVRAAVFSPDGGIAFHGAADSIRAAIHVPSGGIAVGGVGGPIKYEEDGITYYAGVPYHRGPTNQTEILRSLRDRLVNSGVFRETQVYLRGDFANAQPIPPSDDYVEIGPGDKMIEQPAFDGAGLEGDLQREVFEIRVYHRLDLDESGRANEWSANRARGAHRIARLAAAKLHGHELTDGSGTLAVAEPIRLLRIGQSVASPGARGWGYVPILLEILFTSDLIYDRS